jgi:hypothetical protein
MASGGLVRAEDGTYVPRSFYSGGTYGRSGPAAYRSVQDVLRAAYARAEPGRFLGRPGTVASGQAFSADEFEQNRWRVLGEMSRLWAGRLRNSWEERAWLYPAERNWQFYWNSYSDPDRGRVGYLQTGRGSWVRANRQEIARRAAHYRYLRQHRPAAVRQWKATLDAHARLPPPSVVGAGQPQVAYKPGAGQAPPSPAASVTIADGAMPMTVQLGRGTTDEQAEEIAARAEERIRERIRQLGSGTSARRRTSGVGGR